MFRLRLVLVFASIVLLSGCVAQLPWASDARVAQAFYKDPGPTSVTLMTVIANDSNSAGHSSLLINASQRVLYDPAGTWYNRAVPERADMLYGMTPKMLQYYIDYHARKRFRVVMQTLVVPSDVAEMIFRAAVKRGATPSGFCANSTSHLLGLIPGLEDFPTSIWPKSAVQAMARVPGVKTREIYQDDEGKDLHGA